MTIRYLRLKSVRDRRANRSRSSIYADIAEGMFPPSIPLSPDGRSVAWPEHEVAAVNAAVLAGASAEQTRALVRDLVAMRSTISASAADEDIWQRTNGLVAKNVAASHTAKAA